MDVTQTQDEKKQRAQERIKEIEREIRLITDEPHHTTPQQFVGPILLQCRYRRGSLDDLGESHSPLDVLYHAADAVLRAFCLRSHPNKIPDIIHNAGMIQHKIDTRLKHDPVSDSRRSALENVNARCSAIHGSRKQDVYAALAGTIEDLADDLREYWLTQDGERYVSYSSRLVKARALAEFVGSEGSMAAEAVKKIEADLVSWREGGQRSAEAKLNALKSRLLTERELLPLKEVAELLEGTPSCFREGTAKKFRESLHRRLSAIDPIPFVAHYLDQDWLDLAGEDTPIGAAPKTEWKHVRGPSWVKNVPRDTSFDRRV
jgi:hypothetical protein